MRLMLLVVILALLAVFATAQPAPANDLSAIGTAFAEMFQGAEVHEGLWVQSNWCGPAFGASLPMTNLGNVARKVPVLGPAVLGPVADHIRFYGVMPLFRIEGDGTTTFALDEIKGRFGPGLTLFPIDDKWKLEVSGGYDIAKLGRGADGGERKGAKKLLPHGVYFCISREI